MRQPLVHVGPRLTVSRIVVVPRSDAVDQMPQSGVVEGLQLVCLFEGEPPLRGGKPLGSLLLRYGASGMSPMSVKKRAAGLFALPPTNVTTQPLLITDQRNGQR